MTQTHRTIAVLTGDIIGSTALGSEKLERAIKALSTCADTQQTWMGESLNFTRHRGDGWQVVLAKPKYALRSALAFRAALRAEDTDFATYIGLAEGRIEGTLDTNLNSASADVFVQSGHALDMAAMVGPESLIFEPQQPKYAVLPSVDYISKSWTQAQAAAILPMLAPNTQTSYTDIAKALGKSRQSVTKSLASAGLEAIQRTLEILESDESHV
ncbi:hypothetical protein EDD53_0885 [Pacificibacter maritimus]|uniref:SatD family protein n=1 Tax=Pacificibacter maritimus TaxID=762213 RepID=A0A3N4V3R7_9RHOB|nr:hypothetical protein [Pacificibacter maritimus]RPE71757.1 hypothetical protein EDD53_0885 [Pacificibacter maritimus]